MKKCNPALDADVVIAGAGPAGLSCAIAAANRGLRVEVIDGMTPPIDKACGEGLMPDSLAALSALGFDINRIFSQTESFLLRGIRFFNDSHTATEAAFPSSPGRGIRRTVLHQLLLDRATQLGVRFHWQTVVQGITRSTVQTSRGTLHTRYMIGADGHNSRIAAWAELTKSSTHSRRIGLRQHYAIAPWTDFVEVYWSDHGQAYVTPIAANEVCVAYIANTKFPSSRVALSNFPALEAHLAAAPPSDSPRGSITICRRLRRVTAGSIALIGDASGSVDALTGEGLALCFRQALALANALSANDLASYEQAHRNILRLPRFMSRTMLLMDKSPLLRSRTFDAFEDKPGIFPHLLNVHIGHSPLQFFGLNGVFMTGLHILTS